MSGDDLPTMPPVRLPAEAELARDALAAPLLSRAARLARWAERGVPVGAGGELLTADLAEAAAQLGLEPEEDGTAAASEAWCFAVDTGLVEVAEHEEEGADSGSDPDSGGADGAGPDGGGADGGGADDDGTEVVGTATPGEELKLLVSGTPGDVLEIWAGGLDAVLADAATPSFESLLGTVAGAFDESGQINPDAIDLDSLDWDPEEESGFLDSALGNLYLLTATDEAVADGAMVPLPVVAAAMVVPDDMEEPTDDVLDEVSAVMMRLDEQFRVLADTGLLEYDPVDEALVEPVDEDEPPPAVDEDEDLTRYGQVRLTPLGLYGVRQRMLGVGFSAPAVGELAEVEAEVLLLALADRMALTARAEAESWLERREPLNAARELLAAARGSDPLAPSRRLTSQLVLSLADPAAEPALREVLDDPELGGLARVWLTERGAAEVPAPSEEMVFWLTVDTLAAQLDSPDGEQEGLAELVRGLAEQHQDFFDRAWQVDHPATVEVLEAVGRLHPDRQLAKAARRAAFRAASLRG